MELRVLDALNKEKFNSMRAKIVDNKVSIVEIIRNSKICFVGMAGPEASPYVLPFNFGTDDEYIYLHSGNAGKKIDFLKNNPEVCIAFSNSEQLAHQNENVACSHFMRYKSALVFGRVEFINDYNEKIKALNTIMRHYTGRDDFEYNNPAVNNVLVYKVKMNNISGKTFGY